MYRSEEGAACLLRHADAAGKRAEFFAPFFDEALFALEDRFFAVVADFTPDAFFFTGFAAKQTEKTAKQRRQ